jgi:hypothetical protein
MIDRILDEYRLGNTDTRLGLFMYYRELRDEFFHVEQEDAAASPGARSRQSRLRSGSVFKRISTAPCRLIRSPRQGRT